MPLFRRLCYLWLFGGMLVATLPAYGQVLREETCVGVAVDFPTRFLAPSGRIERWEWHFGDPESGAANVSRAREPQHTYREPGTYEAFLITYSDRGLTDTLHTEVVVHPKPLATFTPEFNCEQQTITLIPDDPTLRHAYWRLGDGRSDTSLRPTFRYASSGTYTVSMWAMSDLPGCREQGTQSLTWPLHARKPRLAQSPTTCFGEPATLAVEAHRASTIHWYEDPDTSLPLGEGSEWQTPILSFSTSYYATAVHPQSGCESERIPVPVLVLSPEDLNIKTRFLTHEELPARVRLSVQGDTEAASFTWDFGDSQTSIEASPIHTFTQAGVYPIRVEIMYPAGCQISLWDSIRIVEPPKVALPTAFSPNGDGVNDELRLELSNLETFALSVYDRWGHLMYETHNPRFQWDGRGPSGKLVPEGVYICVIEGQDAAGTSFRKKDVLTIIR